MIPGRYWRLCLFCLVWLPFPAAAIDRIDIRVEEIRHPAAQIENFSATLDTQGRWQGRATLKQGKLDELTKGYLLPVTVSRGTAAGQVAFAGEHGSLQQIKMDADLREIAFSDAAGLRAGEKVGGHVSMQAQQEGGRWHWQTAMDWQGGEVFWQPLYFPSGGITVKTRGWLSAENLVMEEGSADFVGVGQTTFRGNLELADKSFETLEVSGIGLDAGKGYEQFVKPFLEKTLLGNLEVAGSADVQASLVGGKLSAFQIGFHDVDVEDKSGRFAFYKLNTRIPWALRAATQANLQFAGGRLLNLPLGSADLEAKLDGWSLTAPEWRVPLLDSVMNLQNISLAQIGGQWHGHLAARLAPVSMSEFSHAVGWPRMEGKLAASTPLVTYSGGQLALDGAMQFDVFDGRVSVSNVSLQNPLGLAPRLNTNIQMRSLDLGLLTQTFSFGAISGRLDGDVNGLELSGWKPVRFDADFRSSPGDYPKKISQRAVENISALGGAGAAAAIQRSFLRFFNQFNYSRIGLSCKLRNGVCAMDGVEKAAQGYVIVKGSGIPAITVLGYNSSVSWSELLERVQRITQGNVKPVVK